MPMTPDQALAVIKTYLPEWCKATAHAELMDDWYRGSVPQSVKPTMPKKPTKEFRDLRDRAMTPWLKFVVNALTQILYVEGYRAGTPSDDGRPPPAWEAWQANGMDSRQIAVHRSAIAHAVSYVSVLPGEPFPMIRGHSARRMCAFYQDVAVDDWPMYAIAGKPIVGADGRGYWRFTLYDEEARYTFDAKSREGDGLKYLEFEEHMIGECPVVRYANQVDLDGRTEGEVEPYINLAARIDQDTFDRLVVQRFGAWVVRYATGLAEPTTDEEKRAAKLRLSVEDILVTENPDAKFGTLEATSLDGYIRAREADIRDLAAVSQTPPQDFLGQIVNISAEALAAAEAGRTRKADERKHTFGEAHEQVLRLAAYLMGDLAGATDYAAQVVWKDVESRSLSQVADAFGKLASQLGVPPEMLWHRIPGWTSQDVEEAKRLAQSQPGLNALVADLTAGLTSRAAANGDGG
jgi:hypothetical protein